MEQWQFIVTLPDGREETVYMTGSEEAHDLLDRAIDMVEEADGHEDAQPLTMREFLIDWRRDYMDNCAHAMLMSHVPFPVDARLCQKIDEEDIPREMRRKMAENEGLTLDAIRAQVEQKVADAVRLPRFALHDELASHDAPQSSPMDITRNMFR